MTSTKVLSLAARIAEKRAAALVRKAEQFPEALALDLIYLLDATAYGYVDKVQLLIDWLDPAMDSATLKDFPVATLEATRLFSSWKILAVAQRLGLNQGQVIYHFMRRGIK